MISARAVRRARRHRRAAVQPRAVRGDDRARRRRRRSRASKALRALRSRAPGRATPASAPRPDRAPRRRQRPPTRVDPRRARAGSNASTASFPADAQDVLHRRRAPPRSTTRTRPTPGSYLDRLARRRRAARRTTTRAAARDRAPPRAVDDATKTPIRVAAPEDPRDRASSACAARCACGDDQLLAINEYMHPRLQEICETLPAAARPLARATRAGRAGSVERFTQQGPRHRRLSSLRGFLMLLPVAGDEALAPLHVALSRSRTQRIEQWLQRIAAAAAASTRARRRAGAVPAPGQGLQRHARARLAQLRRP